MTGILAAAALGGATSVSADGPTVRRAIHTSPGARPVGYRMCDRAQVRECQADAKLHVQFCEAFPGRLACVDRALAELSMCWAATGCF